MSSIPKGIQGTVAGISLHWHQTPRGNEGVATVGVGDAGPVEVRWRRDEFGIWIEFPHGVYGFDLEKHVDENGLEVYRVNDRIGPNSWDEVRFQRKGESGATQGAASGRKKTARIRAQMPGKIVKLSVATGTRVEKGQALLIMEAMKMENQITAPMAGVVKEFRVQAGQTVESGADLLVLDGE